ncbi:MAG: serine hydrolase [Rhodothermales bacterium]|nr:serine hydrolase [Rhodothermales bacterium]MBO6781100.1 serine hydrolase [Rhodothermales bacterium]
MLRRFVPALVLLWVLVLPACAQDAVFPGETWEYAPAAEYGWELDALQGVNAFIRDSTNTTGLVLVDRGKVVLEFGDTQELSYLASVRKSVLALLYGNYVADGTVDLDATLADLGMDDIQGLTDREKRATVRDLISARSGVYHPASNAGDNSDEAPVRGSQEPGTYYLYNNWDFNAAGAAFELITGRDIYDALETDLAVPLGFEDWDRGAQRKSGDTSRSRYRAYHIWMSTRDMARIGHLMLNDGNWNGTQVVPADWARETVSLITPREEMNPARWREGEFGYGYMWWVWDGPQATGDFEGAYTARGYFGQYITVLPAAGIVIAHKTKAAYGRFVGWDTYMAVVRRILEARR